MRLLCTSLVGLIMIATMTSGASAKLVDLHHAPFVKVDDDLYVGMYCRVSSGGGAKGRTVLDTIIESIPIAGTVIGNAIKKALTNALGEEIGKVVLKNGDAYCAWLYLNAIPPRVNRTYLSRTDFADHGGLLRCTMGFCVEPSHRARKSGTLQLKIYDAGKPLADGKGQSSKQCDEHTRCWTGGVGGNEKATADTAGFASCLELKKKNGTLVSILFAQGKLPDAIKATTGALVENVGCDKRFSP